MSAPVSLESSPTRRGGSADMLVTTPESRPNGRERLGPTPAGTAAAPARRPPRLLEGDRRPSPPRRKHRAPVGEGWSARAPAPPQAPRRGVRLQIGAGFLV